MTNSSWAQDADLPLGRRQLTLRGIESASGAVALTIEAIIIIATSVASGAIFHLVTRNGLGPVNSFFATGAITAALYCSLIRIWSAPPSLNGQRKFVIRRSLACWCITFVFLIVISFALKISNEFSRGTIFSFFVAGGIVASGARRVIPNFVATVLATTGYRGRQAVIACPKADDAQHLLSSLSQGGCETHHLITYDSDDEGSLPWVERVERLAQQIIESSRTSVDSEIYIIGSRLPEGMLDLLLQRLRLVPRAVYLVPEDQVARLLKLQARKIGDNVVVEMQRAPLSGNARRRILIYGINYAPEPIGVGRYTDDIANYLVRHGAKVEVVSAVPHYPGWTVPMPFKNRYSVERKNSVRVTHCPLVLTKNVRGIWRLLVPLSFVITSSPIVLWRIIRSRPDAVLCIEPTLMCAPAALLGAWIVGSHTVLHVQDLEIDAAFAAQ